jgi:hypothetical protein
MRNSQPWLRKATGTWYVWFDGKQRCLGRDKDQAHESFRRMTQSGVAIRYTVRQVVKSYRSWTRQNLAHTNGLQNVRLPESGDWTHYLSVFEYPVFVRFTFDHFSSSYSIGRIGNTTNGIDVRVALSRMFTNGLAGHHVTLREQVPGDFSSSGIVGAEDYVVWRDSPLPLGPFLTSYDSWRSNFGEGAASGSAADSIPEPATSLMALLGIVLLLGNERRPRHDAK